MDIAERKQPESGTKLQLRELIRIRVRYAKAGGLAESVKVDWLCALRDGPTNSSFSGALPFAACAAGVSGKRAAAIGGRRTGTRI
jgi:hypothetical protein